MLSTLSRLFWVFAYYEHSYTKFRGRIDTITLPHILSLYSDNSNCPPNVLCGLFFIPVSNMTFGCHFSLVSFNWEQSHFKNISLTIFFFLKLEVIVLQHVLHSGFIGYFLIIRLNLNLFVKNTRWMILKVTL